MGCIEDFRVCLEGQFSNDEKERERAWLLGRLEEARLRRTEIRLRRTEIRMERFKKFHCMVRARRFCRHR